jgi:hypothetical protein
MGKLLTMKEMAERMRRSEKALAWQLHANPDKMPPSALIGGRRMFDEDLYCEWQRQQFDRASA